MFKNEYEVIDGVAYVKLHMKKTGTHICKIDEDDLNRLKEFNHNWHLMFSETTKDYYARATQYKGIKNGKVSQEMVYMHRFLMDCPKGMTVDHLNYDTLDNRKENLRVVSIAENNKNRQNKANNNSKTGIRNVSYSKSDDKFVVQFQVEGKNTVMGRFNTLEEAKEYADNNRYKYYTNVS